ncbi:MAG: WG repeat-containing protein [Bacteroidota bacterium]
MRKIAIILLICFGSKAQAGKIPEAYEALSVFDYFKAKQLFYRSLSKYPAESSFGLATIYFRTDNPFSNIDSAAKYISITQKQFKDTATYSLYHINRETIRSLAVNIGAKGFEKYGTQNQVESLDHFLSNFYFADSLLLEKGYLKRDGIYLSNALATQSSDSMTQFLLRFPQSSLFPKAKKLFYDYQYFERVPQKNINQYQLFIKQYPNNPNISFAETNLFNLIQPLHMADSIYNFIKHYSTDLTREAAWKLLYSTSVRSYSKEELTAFLTKYPDYPFNETILKEIALSQNILIPLKNADDKFGFIDTLGTWVIQSHYDDALPFSEGFASVCKNDSCFYINKEGQKISNHYFEEAESYKDGVAIVKKDNVYFLINRSGQYISKGYQDMNRPFEKLYIAKSNNTYGAINAKGEIVIPFSYKKLGNFKNGYAYYMAAQYGLVDVNNRALQANWDWISDVDTNSMVVVKRSNQFGLMTVDELLILPTEFDYITYCSGDIYLVVKKNLYGFFNSKGKCFVTAVEYDYNPAFEPDYYTNGTYFKLMKDDEVALIDANGRYSINFNTYSNLFFAKDDIIRIQKNNKYGYVDRKLKPITAVEFEEAQDFKNDVAIVSKKGISQLINTQGKAIYTLKGGFIHGNLKGLYYRVSLNELIGLINNKGEVLLNTEYLAIEQITTHLFYCKKAEGIFLYNANTKTLKKIQ